MIIVTSTDELKRSIKQAKKSMVKVWTAGYFRCYSIFEYYVKQTQKRSDEFYGVPRDRAPEPTYVPVSP